MKIFNKLTLLSFAILLVVGFAAHSQTTVKSDTTDLEHIKFTVSSAPEWSDLLKRESGWFGGDGIYTIPLDGVENRQAAAKDKVLFIFSDSMIGEIRNNKLVPGYKMIHNATAVLTGSKPIASNINFSWKKGDKGSVESAFTPTTPKTEKTDYYWLGDGFVNQSLNNSIYIFGYRVRIVQDGAFGFKQVGNTLIKIPKGSKPPYVDQSQIDAPLYLGENGGELGSYGAGVFVNTKAAGAKNPDGYIYIYGVRGMGKRTMVARVLPKDFEQFDKWTYYDGTNWGNDINKAAEITNHVSDELSLTELPDGRYAMVFQVDGMSTAVAMRIGKTPYGPFGPIIKLWDCKPDLQEKTYVVYNAKAHPSLSAPGELLISYNINSVEFDKDLEKSPNFYRPRFIRVKFQ